MIRRSMRVGAARTSVKLEPEFWDYLAEVARARRLPLSALVTEVAATAAPERASLASRLRVFALAHARRTARNPAPGTADGGRRTVETVSP